MILRGKHIVYLDQNKWSDIMKAVDNPMYQDGKYLAVVQKIIEKSKKQEWIFPVSYIHFAETLIWKNTANSYKLGNALDAISNKYTMTHFYDVLKDEIIRVAQGKEMLKTYLIQGDPFAFTGSKALMTFEDYDGSRLPEVEKEFQEFFNQLNIYGISMNSDYFDRNEIEQNYVYLYAVALYLTGCSMRKAAGEVRKKFGIKKFSHSTISRTFAALQLNAESLSQVCSQEDAR